MKCPDHGRTYCSTCVEGTWSVKTYCRLPGCKAQKREGYATCGEHSKYEQWVLRELHHLQHCPCFPGPGELGWNR